MVEEEPHAVRLLKQLIGELSVYDDDPRSVQFNAVRLLHRIYDRLYRPEEDP